MVALSLLTAAGCQPEETGTSTGPRALNVSAGFWNFTDVECDPSAQRVPLMQMSLSTGSGYAVTVETLTVRATGPLADPGRILGLVLAVDGDGNGRYNPAGGDVVLLAAEPFGAGGEAVLSPSRTVPAGSSETWVLVADLADTATAGAWLETSLDAATGVSARDATGEPLSAGGTLDGARVAVPVGCPVWSERSPSGGGPARAAHACVRDPASRRMIVFGGTDGSASFNDVHALDLSAGNETWSLLAPAGVAPAVRHDATAVRDPVSGDMVVFGGANAQYLFNDLWRLSLTAGAEAWSCPVVSGTPPSARYGALGVYDIHRSRVVICGGTGAAPTNPHLGDAYLLDLTGASPSWSAWNVGSPPGYSQSGHVGFYDEEGPCTWMFSGLANPGMSINRLYYLGGASTPAVLAETSVPGAPDPVAWAAGARRGSSGRFYVFGGFEYTTGVPVGDLFAFEPAGSGRWTLVLPEGTPPSPRCMHSMVYDPLEDRLILYGGQAWTAPAWTTLDEVWELRW